LQFLTGSDTEVIHGIHGLVEYIPGNTNLIISVPHGGEMKPPFMPDRAKAKTDTGQSEEKDKVEDVVIDEDAIDDDTNNKISTTADIFTQEIGRVIAIEYEEFTQRRPHLILANLHRCKMDPNRPVQNAALGDSLAEAVYNQYHRFIEDAKKSIDGPGLLIDLHGQNHHQNSIEIGYLFTKKMLNNEDYTSISPSIASLIKRRNISVPDILHGDNSLGAMFDELGYRSCPSPYQHYPGTDRYYKGGYITQTHGSNNEGDVDAIQLELPSEIRHENGQVCRDKFSRACARVLIKFIDTYYTEHDTESFNGKTE